MTAPHIFMIYMELLQSVLNCNGVRGYKGSMISTCAKLVRATVCAVIALSASVGDVAAQASVATELTRSTFHVEDTGVAPGGTVWLGFHQNVEAGWHVFWKNPGDAGIPVNFQWQLPDGYSVGDTEFPVPHFIPVGPLASFAHEGEPVFLVPLTAPGDAVPGDAVRIGAKGQWQVCEEVCVPEDAFFEFELPVVETQTARADVADIFAMARAAMARPLDGNATISRDGDNYMLAVEPSPFASAEDVFFFPDVEGLITPAAAQRAAISDGILRVALTPGWISDTDASRIDGIIAERRAGGGAAFELSANIRGSLSSTNSTEARNVVLDAPTRAPTGFFTMLALAFFGGIILNAMPCVFPILAVKAASLARKGDDLSVIRTQGFIYAVGVMASFLAIAGLLMVLRAGGEQLGWGFHLQSPIIVGLSAYTMFLVGLNLSGVFSVGENLAGVGDGLARKSGNIGSFFTGVLAVIVAAPCVGPLLTAPIGAALTLPTLQGIVVFAALALGFAVPFTMISAVPALAKRLPKPGAWMNLVKQLLAFPVYAAAAYFLWVFIRQTGDEALGGVLGGALILAIAAWAFEVSKREGRLGFVARIASAIAFVAALVPVVNAQQKPQSPVVSTPNYGVLATEAYSMGRLVEHMQDGTPVFIDFTASWCVTCQFNKVTVLKTRDVTDVFAETGTVLMVADWTVRDPEITQALEQYNASGVPLYVYYNEAGEAALLPPTLSKSLVIETLRAGAG